MRIFTLILLLFMMASAGAAQERYVKPFDEAAKDASFLAFRNKLIAAAERRDLKYVMSILDPKVELSFGGHSGLKGFRELWTGKKEPEFWDEFLRVIRNGGRFHPATGTEPATFTAPYTFSDFPEDIDMYEYAVVFGSNVNLRESPDLNSKVVARLSYNIVKTDYENSVKTDDERETVVWTRVETLGGLKGFMKPEFVRSPIDHRAGFTKKRGRWLMTFFIAGD